MQCFSGKDHGLQIGKRNQFSCGICVLRAVDICKGQLDYFSVLTLFHWVTYVYHLDSFIMNDSLKESCSVFKSKLVFYEVEYIVSVWEMRCPEAVSMFCWLGLGSG